MRQNYYSVPARYASRRLPVRLSASSVEVLDGPRVVARHERAAGKYAEILILDHYLEVLQRKPGALDLPAQPGDGELPGRHTGRPSARVDGHRTRLRAGDGEQRPTLLGAAARALRGQFGERGPGGQQRQPELLPSAQRTRPWRAARRAA